MSREGKPSSKNDSISSGGLKGQLKLSSHPTLYGLLQQKKRKRDSSDSSLSPLKRLYSNDNSQSSLDDSSQDVIILDPPTPKLQIPKTLNTSSISTTLWVDKYRPKTLKDLAVHPKKIKDVAEHLLIAVYACRRVSTQRRNSFIPPSLRILILTGPPGSGKTATINLLLGPNALINEYTGIDKVTPELIEYKNPPQVSSINLDDIKMGESRSFGTQRESKLIPFLRQIKNLKYPSLTIQEGTNSNDPKDKILLVEDMPYLHDAKQRKIFQEAISEYLSDRIYYPIVFIISDDTTKGSNACNFIFSKEILSSSSVKIIPFNTVSVTLVTKTLTKIASSEKLMVSKEDIRALADTCQGDIRSAINMIQFATTKNANAAKNTKVRQKIDFPVQKVMKKNRKKTSGYELFSVFPDIGRDFTLSLYHSVGKVMHRKRLNDFEIDDAGRVVQSIKDHPTIKATSPLFRMPLKAVPEDIIEKHITSERTSEIFVQFIHENYTNFCDDIDDIASAADYFSCADLLSHNYLDNQTLREYINLTCVRGFMFTPNNDKKESKFSAFYKPHSLKAYKTRDDNWSITKRIFQSEDSFFFNNFFRNGTETPQPLTLKSRKVLAAETMPFTGSMLNNTQRYHPLRQKLVSPSQASFVQSLCRYNMSRQTTSKEWKTRNQIDESISVESVVDRNESDERRNDVIIAQIQREIENLRLQSTQIIETMDEIEDC